MRTRRGTRTSIGCGVFTATRWWPDVTMLSALRSQGDRLLAIAFVLMVTVALAGITTGDTGASFTSTSTNPNNHANTLLVQPPASQNATTSSAAGVVNLSWTATPTAAGTGH